MSDFTLEIYDTNNILEIETSTEDNTENLEIAVSTTDSLEIYTGFNATVVYANDIVGLDNYLSNYLADYVIEQIDCGTP